MQKGATLGRPRFFSLARQKKDSSILDTCLYTSTLLEHSFQKRDRQFILDLLGKNAAESAHTVSLSYCQPYKMRGNLRIKGK